MEMGKCGAAEAKRDMGKLLALGVFAESEKFGRGRRDDIRPEDEKQEKEFREER